MQLQPNIVFDNHYTLIRQLGRGGFSEVWLAHDSYMDLDVALKIYAPGQGMDNTSINEFRHEIKDVFNLNHSNLLKPQYLGIYEQMPYLVLSYCQGGSVTKQIGKTSEQQIWKLIHDVASGLAYLHQRDIVHQDIKPDNILVDDAGNYVITDFGISTKARSTLRKSVLGGAVSGGTMAYMGPERFSKQPAPTKASDIWSFGAMIYELVTGNVPFGEMGGGLQRSGAEIPEIDAHISTSLKSTVAHMLALETWDRPTAEQLAKISPDTQPDTSATIPHVPQSNKQSHDRATQRYTPDDVNKSLSESPHKVPPTTGTKGNNGKKWWVLMFIVIPLVLGCVFLFSGQNGASSTSKSVNSTVSHEYSSSSTNSQQSVDRQRVERLIANICRNSSRGGNYSALKDYFAYTISPHPSGETRYSSNIGEKTKNFVENYPKYEISAPYDFAYDKTSFPLIVRCNVYVTWTMSNGTRKRAWIHKTYYINSDYKVTGFRDDEYKRTTLY